MSWPTFTVRSQERLIKFPDFSRFWTKILKFPDFFAQFPNSLTIPGSPGSVATLKKGSKSFYL